MTIELILDNREHHLIQELQKTNSFTFTKEQLDVGDILFRRDQNRNQSGKGAGVDERDIKRDCQDCPG